MDFFSGRWDDVGQRMAGAPKCFRGLSGIVDMQFTTVHFYTYFREYHSRDGLRTLSLLTSACTTQNRQQSNTAPDDFSAKEAQQPKLFRMTSTYSHANPPFTPEGHALAIQSASTLAISLPTWATRRVHPRYPPRIGQPPCPCPPPPSPF